jgi:hypothetical protein
MSDSITSYIVHIIYIALMMYGTMNLKFIRCNLI